MTRDNLIWMVGWNFPAAAICAGVAGVLASQLHSVAGALVATAIVGFWFYCTTQVNARADEILTRGAARLKEDAQARLQDTGEGETYILLFPVGKAHLGIQRAPQYDVAILHLGEQALGVYDQAHYDMPARKAVLANATRKIHYDNISGVDLDSGIVNVALSAGGNLTYAAGGAEDEATAFVTALRARLREFKARASQPSPEASPQARA